MELTGYRVAADRLAGAFSTLADATPGGLFARLSK
jgi:hypothetical protein